MDILEKANHIELISDSITKICNAYDTLHINMQGVLQTVQNHTETFWGMSIEKASIIIPTVVTLIIFIVGILIDRYLKRQEQKKETNSYRETLFKWIDLVATPVADQIEIVNQFVISINNNTTLQNERLSFKKSMIDKLNIASADNVFKYLLNNSSAPKNDERAKMAFNLVSQIDFLNAFESQIGVQYDSYQHESIALFEAWNSNIINIQNQCCSIGTTNEVSFLRTLKKIVDEWKKKQNSEDEINVYIAMKHMINPILELASDYQLGKKGFDECDAIIISAKHLALTYDRWKTLSSGFADVFKEYAKSASNSLSVLIEAKEYFSKNTKAIK